MTTTFAVPMNIDVEYVQKVVQQYGSVGDWLHFARIQCLCLCLLLACLFLMFTTYFHLLLLGLLSVKVASLNLTQIRYPSSQRIRRGASFSLTTRSLEFFHLTIET